MRMLLLVKHQADVNAKHTDGSMPLHVAAENRHRKVVRLLLDNKADVNAPK